MTGEPSKLQFKGLADLASEYGAARFELRQVMPELGPEPLTEGAGLVDFRERSFETEDQRVIGRVLYGREPGEPWSSVRLGTREIVGPIWLLELLRGTTGVQELGTGADGLAAFELVVSFRRALQKTGADLDVPMGLDVRDLDRLRATVTVDERLLPREVEVALPGLQVACRFTDFGTDASLGPPPAAVQLAGPSRLGFMAWALRAIARRPARGG